MCQNIIQFYWILTGKHHFKSKPDKIFSCFSLYTMQEQIEMSPPDTASTVWLFCRQLEHEYCTKVIAKLISPSRWLKAVVYKTAGACAFYILGPFYIFIKIIYIIVNSLSPGVSVVHIVWSSRWGYFWKDQLLVTDVLTTWAEVIFWVK